MPAHDFFACMRDAGDSIDCGGAGHWWLPRANLGGREDGAAGRLQWIELKGRQVIVGRRIRDALSRFVRQAMGQGEGRMQPEAELPMVAHGGPGAGIRWLH